MGASDVTLPALKPNIISNLTYDGMERNPMDYRDYVDWNLPWPLSASPKRWLLAKFIIAKFRMNRIVREVQGEACKCAGRGGQCESERRECRLSIRGAALCGLRRILLLKPSTRHGQVGKRLCSLQMNSVMMKQLCEFVLKLVKIEYSLFVNSLLFL
jgi:hypothetical protein